MPRTRGNIERRRNSLSESDLDNISVRMENATLKAFEKHRLEAHEPLLARVGKLQGDVRGVKIAGGILALLIAGLEAVGTWVRR